MGLDDELLAVVKDVADALPGNTEEIQSDLLRKLRAHALPTSTADVETRSSFR